METFRYNVTICPWGCGAKLDACTETMGSGEEPNDGDFSVCVNCGNWLQIQKEGNHMTLIKPSIETICSLGEDEIAMLTRATEIVKEINEVRREKREKEKENAE